MDGEELTNVIELLRVHGTDTSRVEAKAAAGGLGDSVWESVSAFANTAGGTIILGLDERTGFRPAPGFDPGRVADQFSTGAAGPESNGGRFTNPPSTRIESVTFEGSPLLIIEVEPNQIGSRPCFITKRGPQNGAYKRVGDADQRLSAYEVFELQNELVSQGSDRDPVPGTSLGDLDMPSITSLLAHPRSQRAQTDTDSLETRLLRLNVLTADGEATLAGLLTLGKYPQQFLPRIVVDVTAHPGIEKSDPLTEHRFLDREICEGTVPEMVDRAVAVTRRNLRTHSIVTGAGREDRLEIPEDAIREAIANAVVHREYNPRFHSLDVSVDIYPDRVTISSPGGLWGGVTVQSLADGVSHPRNPTLLSLVQSVPSSSGFLAAEGAGGGIRLIINKMATASLQRPEFRAGPASVTVELRRHGAEVTEFRDWLNSLADRHFSPREDAILLTLKSHGSASVAELHHHLHYDSADIELSLEQLREEGIVRLTPSGQYTVSTGSPLPSTTDASILKHLSPSHPTTIHELAESSGRTAEELRRSLRRLVRDGWVIATAPPTSRNRKYLRAQ